MKIRFLRVCDSDTPGFPFMPGQVIDVACPSSKMLALLAPREDGSVIAEAVRSEADEAVADAVIDPEMAVRRPARKRERSRVG